MKTKPCSNPECNKSFDLKNPKKRFCSLICKNKTAYLYAQKIYKWENSQFKARRKNIQILEYYHSQNIFKLTIEDLKKIGFDLNASYLPLKNELNQTVFRFGNIIFILLSSTDCEIKKI